MEVGGFKQLYFDKEFLPNIMQSLQRYDKMGPTNITSSPSPSADSRSIPWLGEGLSMPS